MASRNGAVFVKSFSLLIVAILLASTIAATAFFIVPRFTQKNSSLTIVVEGTNRLVPGAKGLYGWVEVKGTAPGIWGVEVTKAIPKGVQSISINLPAQKIIKLSRNALAMSARRGVSVQTGEASTITITLYLYDSKGHHYIATAVIGSYDIALEDLHDSIKAFYAVEKDPYYIYTHRRVIKVPLNKFAVIDATQTYSTIVHKIYNMSLSRLPRNTRIKTTSYSLTCNNVVTIDNYQSYRTVYGFDFSYDDFVALPSLYYSNMPQDFASHLSGANPEEVYDTFRKVFGTAVYVPLSCVAPVDAAITHWYHYIWPGIKKLSTFWSQIAGVSVEWESVTPVDKKEYIYKMPLAVLIAQCDSNCARDNPEIGISIAQAKYKYYKKGLTVLGQLVLGKENELILGIPSSTSTSPIDAANNEISYLVADIERTWHGDGVYIDYYVEQAYIYNYYDGSYYVFWRIVPIVAFTPLYDDTIIPKTLHGVRVRPGESSYNELYSKYLEEIKYIDITPVKIYDKVITSSSEDSETIDLVGTYASNADALAGLATGLAQQALKKLVITVASEAAKKLLEVVSMVLSYAYTSRDASKSVIRLERISNVPAGVQVHVVIYRYDQYLGYSSTAGVDKAVAPFVMTYEIKFNPNSGGPPPQPPYLPTQEDSEEHNE